MVLARSFVLCPSSPILCPLSSVLCPPSATPPKSPPHRPYGEPPSWRLLHGHELEAVARAPSPLRQGRGGLATSNLHRPHPPAPPHKPHIGNTGNWQHIGNTPPRPLTPPVAAPAPAPSPPPPSAKSRTQAPCHPARPTSTTCDTSRRTHAPPDLRQPSNYLENLHETRFKNIIAKQQKCH